VPSTSVTFAFDAASDLDGTGTASNVKFAPLALRPTVVATSPPR